MSSFISNVTDENFGETLENNTWLVADFSAEWCGPCRTLAPIFESVAEKLHDKAGFVKVDVDNAQGAAAKFQVTSVPTVILFKNGEEVDRSVGVKDEDAFSSWITSAM